MEEEIYIVHWDGLYSIEQIKEKKDTGYVLYQIYGSHHLYGRDVLLYIGESHREKKLLRERIEEHDRNWSSDEYDVLKYRIGSIAKFNNGWKDWDEDDDKGPYEQAEAAVVDKIERLLIYAHQPVYNQKSKESAKVAKGTRIFNTGKVGQLFPELSYLYFVGDL